MHWFYTTMKNHSHIALIRSDLDPYWQLLIAIWETSPQELSLISIQAAYSCSCAQVKVRFVQLEGAVTATVPWLVTTVAKLSTWAGTSLALLQPTAGNEKWWLCCGLSNPLALPLTPAGVDSWCRWLLWLRCVVQLTERGLTEITGCESCLQRRTDRHLNPCRRNASLSHRNGQLSHLVLIYRSCSFSREITTHITFDPFEIQF